MFTDGLYMELRNSVLGPRGKILIPYAVFITCACTWFRSTLTKILPRSTLSSNDSHRLAQPDQHFIRQIDLAVSDFAIKKWLLNKNWRSIIQIA